MGLHFPIAARKAAVRRSSAYSVPAGAVGKRAASCAWLQHGRAFQRLPRQMIEQKRGDFLVCLEQAEIARGGYEIARPHVGHIRHVRPCADYFPKIIGQDAVDLSHKIIVPKPDMDIAIFEDANPEIVGFDNKRAGLGAAHLANLPDDPGGSFGLALTVQLGKGALNIAQRFVMATIMVPPAKFAQRVFKNDPRAQLKTIMGSKTAIQPPERRGDASAEDMAGSVKVA